MIKYAGLEGCMPDAKRCLAFAAESIGLANRAASDRVLQTKLFAMAEAWMKAANEIEISEAARQTKQAG